ARAYPDLADAAALLEKSAKLMLNGLSSPADSYENWFVGANFSRNWALDHHGYMNVGYMYECLSNIAFLYFDCLERGRKVPPELMHNAEELWRVCKRLTFPDGRICRIGGDTRSRYTYCQLFAMQGWLLAAHAFKDEDAVRFEREYLAKMFAEQAANADGSYFGTRLGNVRDASFYYYSRLEADALLAVSTSLHWHRRHKFPSAEGGVDVSRTEAWRDEGEHAIFLRGPRSLRSAAFRSQAGFGQRGRMPNIVCAPTDRSDLAEWSANLVGMVGLQNEDDGWSGTPDKWPDGAVGERFYRDAGGEAFEQVFSAPVEEGAAFGEGEHGDGVGTRRMEIHAVGDGTTMAIRDRVEISRVIQLEHGWSAGRLVIPAPLPGCKERVYAGLGTRCATVDDALSIISVNGGSVSIRRGMDIAFNRPGAQRLMHPLVSDKADELRVAAFDGPMLAEPGSVLYDAVYIVVAGADAAAARKVAESAAWDGSRLAFTGTDGVRRSLDLDFAPGADEGRYDPKTVSRRITEQFLTVSPDDYLPVGYSAPGWLAKGYGWKQRIFYATASLWATALDNARQFGERDLEDRLVAAFRPYLGEKAWMLAPKFHVDFNVVGAVPLVVARLSGDEQARKIGLELANFQWSEPTEKTEIVMKYATLEECRARWKDGYSGETRLWIDDMYMINLLQTEAYKLTGDAKYVRRAAREMCLYLDELQRPDGLFNHAPDVPFAWGRGAGWMAAGMPLVLSQMKQGDEFYDRILAGYRKMMGRLLECQRADGLWGQLVDDPESWSETSGSAMFAYAIAMGVERGWLEGDEWRRSVRRAWCALCDRLDGFGNISDVCVGTDKKNDRAYYLARGRANGDPHGQAPMLWLAGVLGRLNGLGYRCEQTATGVRLVCDGSTVWNFEIDTPEGRPFIHPMLLPSGAPLTGLRPADHVWHLGCWFSWKYINGVNYWEPADERRRGCEPEGRTRVVKKSIACDGAACKVSLDLSYGPRAGGETVLDEARTVEFGQPDANGGYAVTFRHRFTAREDVTLDRTPPHGSTATGKWGGGYAGLTLRLDPAAAKSFEVRGSHGGATPAAVTGVERMSLELANPISGEGVTFTQLAGPDTARFYVWPDKRMVNPSPLYAGPVALRKGETLDLAYRLVVHGGNDASSVRWPEEVRMRYERELYDRIVPFWERHSIDRECGGYLHCLGRDGAVYDTFKDMWLEWREVYMFAALANHNGRKPEWVDLARHGYDFLFAKGRLPDGSYRTRLNRAGSEWTTATDGSEVFTSAFAAMACAELFKATGEERYRAEALSCRAAYWRLANGHETSYRQLAHRVIGLNVANVFNGAFAGAFMDEAERLAAEMRRFKEPNTGLLMERVRADWSFDMDSQYGRFVNPGHAVEAMSFLFAYIASSGRREHLDFARDTALRMFDFGWDAERGGGFVYRDACGKPVDKTDWMLKTWWASCEAATAMLRGWRLTGDSRFLDRFRLVDAYDWENFRDPDFPEWFAYAPVDGRRVHSYKGNVRKGFFHLPRRLLECIDELSAAGDERQ
ncbi:MAG: glycoside hydrolase family 88 protein, partial [Kiritimatiellae bacterium]|nr:glycoside hydrolase family 88 protein [Kiritimatiellia bacterium]